MPDKHIVLVIDPVLGFAEFGSLFSTASGEWETLMLLASARFQLLDEDILLRELRHEIASSRSMIVTGADLAPLDADAIERMWPRHCTGPAIYDIGPALEIPDILDLLADIDLGGIEKKSRTISPKQEFVPPTETKAARGNRLRGNGKSRHNTRR